MAVGTSGDRTSGFAGVAGSPAAGSHEGQTSVIQFLARQLAALPSGGREPQGFRDSGEDAVSIGQRRCAAQPSSAGNRRRGRAGTFTGASAFIAKVTRKRLEHRDGELSRPRRAQWPKGQWAFLCAPALWDTHPGRSRQRARLCRHPASERGGLDCRRGGAPSSDSGLPIEHPSGVPESRSLGSKALKERSLGSPESELRAIVRPVFASACTACGERSAPQGIAQCSGQWPATTPPAPARRVGRARCSPPGIQPGHQGGAALRRWRTDARRHRRPIREQ